MRMVRFRYSEIIGYCLNSVLRGRTIVQRDSDQRTDAVSMLILQPESNWNGDGHLDSLAFRFGWLKSA